MKRSWYAFTGGSGDFTNVLNYHRISVKHACLCGDKICAIYANSNGLHPQEPLSKNMIQYINKALSTELIQPETPFDAKKYVYLKY